MSQTPSLSQTSPSPVPAAWRPYLRGKCFDFALALHKLVPGSQLVAFGCASFPDHVAVQVGERGQLVDIRGPLPIEEMLAGMSGAKSAIETGAIRVSVDQVALHCGLAGQSIKLPAEVRKMAKERLADFAELLEFDPTPAKPRHIGPR
jgi:hypothetical protein